MKIKYISLFYMLALFILTGRPGQALAQESSLNLSGNGSLIRSTDLVPDQADILYETDDKLIIEKYNVTPSTVVSGGKSVEISLYNQLTIGGVVKIINSRGRVMRYELIAPQTDRVGESLFDQGFKMTQEAGEALSGRSGNVFDLFKYAPGDIRAGLQKQTIRLELKPGEKIEITNSARETLAAERFMAITDILANVYTDLSKIKNIPKETLRAAFFEEFKNKAIPSLFKSTVTTSQLTTYEQLVENIDIKTYGRIFTKLLKNISEKADLSGSVASAFTSLSSEAITFFSKDTPIGPIVAFSDIVYKGVQYIKPLQRLYVVEQLAGKNIPPLTSEYVSEKLQPSLSNRGSEERIPMILNNNILAMTQCNSSSISSASCYFRAADNPVQNVNSKQQYIDQERNQSVQQKNTYTNGVILQPPVDIVLQWNQAGGSPLDLDSHLVTPSNDHVYFYNRGNLGTPQGTPNPPNAYLYRDSIPDPAVRSPGTFGVEQTRIDLFQTVQQNGTYYFYVHNYSLSQSTPNGLAEGVQGISNSGAKVTVYQAGDNRLSTIPNDPNQFNLNNPNAQLVGTQYGNPISVPIGQSGDTWAVFRLDTRTGILSPVNQFGTVGAPANVPSFVPAR